MKKKPKRGCSDSYGNKKTRYQTYYDADEVKKYREGQDKSLLLSIYHCRECEGYHLTSN